MKIIGPFTQIVTLRGVAAKGPVKDSDLEIIKDGGVVISDDKIMVFGKFENLLKEYKGSDIKIEKLSGDNVLLPGLIDCHTHLIFGGSRHNDYNSRLCGKSYEEIANEGGGIKSTVRHTRNASNADLINFTKARIENSISNGITTIEIKSGYGLDKYNELRLLRLIKHISKEVPVDIVPTCLAAHTLPPGTEFERKEYLNYILREINPIILNESLAKRQDIFIENSAFDVETADAFLKACLVQGFEITIHADQFSVGGSEVGVKNKAMSVDHLEVSGDPEIQRLAKSDTVGVILPGASLGLGMPFAKARKMLDAGCSIAIASDWNPGSAPMGDLLIQAGILAIYEKLTFAEIFTGMTFRAAKALGLERVGRIAEGHFADFISFPVKDYREILYHQGKLKPHYVWKNGVNISQNLI